MALSLAYKWIKMPRISALLAACMPALSYAQWPQVCAGSNPLTYSPWNTTSCDAEATCCANGFSVSGVGCCPLKSAVCCPGGYTCCPNGTQCVLASGSGWAAIYNCTSTDNVVATNTGVCKPGPPLPLATDGRKNVLVIGDSLSIGYTPYLAQNLSSTALVQHAPWDVSDGGAEETAYGLQCLKYFTASPSGMPIAPDLVLFNWGMHDGPMGNGTTPGQNGPTPLYLGQLAAIATRLQAWAASTGNPTGTKLAFVLTTAYICSAVSDGNVQSMNQAASALMSSYGIPTIDPYSAIVGKCGPAPQPNGCGGIAGCWCPHCPSMYGWLNDAVMSPAVKALLQA